MKKLVVLSIAVLIGLTVSAPLNVANPTQSPLPTPALSPLVTPVTSSITREPPHRNQHPTQPRCADLDMGMRYWCWLIFVGR